MLAVTLIIVYLLFPFGESDVYNKPERVAEVLADYRRDMKVKPSAKIARKVLDFAIASGQPELVYTVLKENIYPWAGTGGVEAEFIRGSKWYISNNALEDNVLWLAEGIHKLDLSTQFNEDLADYYLTLVGHNAVRCGNYSICFERNVAPPPASRRAKARYCPCARDGKNDCVKSNTQEPANMIKFT